MNKRNVMNSLVQGINKYYLGIFFLLIFNKVVAQVDVPDAFIRFNEIYSQQLDPAFNEYNFWNGHWDVAWKAWTGPDTYGPNGTSLHRVFSVLDGKGLVELAYNDSIYQGSKIAGFSIRYYDAQIDKWVMIQSWPGRNSPNISSLQGTHSNGRIQLYQKGVMRTKTKYYQAGTPYDNRYTFSDASEDSYRWDSAFSIDSMRTWFTKYMVEGNRIEDFNSLRVPDQPYWFTQGDGYNCDDSVLVDLQPFLGQWTGKTTFDNNNENEAVTSSRVLLPFLSNCAAFGYQITDLKDNPTKEILFATYVPSRSEWLLYVLNNRKGESQTLYGTRNLKATQVAFEKRNLFNVPSSNPIVSMTWKIENGKLELKALDQNRDVIYETVLSEIE